MGYDMASFIILPPNKAGQGIVLGYTLCCIPINLIRFNHGAFKEQLDIDCVLERTRGMLAEVTFDPTGQV